MAPKKKQEKKSRSGGRYKPGQRSAQGRLRLETVAQHAFEKGFTSLERAVLERLPENMHHFRVEAKDDPDLIQCHTMAPGLICPDDTWRGSEAAARGIKNRPRAADCCCPPAPGQHWFNHKVKCSEVKKCTFLCCPEKLCLGSAGGGVCCTREQRCVPGEQARCENRVFAV
mmetsp:Transcript_66781/g.193348  ORF Transcript_66781/g.193348 Transcript_66781/m.193348 type:complete len:171 (+) Transcript_66781:123-635(+)